MDSLPTADTFTFCVLDFDDTLIPSKICRLFAGDLSIDLFELFSTTKLVQLQKHIIECIERIRAHYTNKGKHIHFSVVSNASQTWLDYMFKGTYLTLLDKYFALHGISIVAASNKAYEFLKKHFGEQAKEIFETSTNSERNEHRFMWKYTAFCSEICAFRRKTGRKCVGIISVGDGNDEEKALKKYSKTHKIKSLHIRLLRASTFEQLLEQWKYVTLHFMNHIEGKRSDEEYAHFYLSDISAIDALNTDNNKYCTGKMHQLDAVHRYFEYWMNRVCHSYDVKHKQIALENVCGLLYQRLFSLNTGSESIHHLRLILIGALCKNTEFNGYFNAGYRKNSYAIRSME